MKMYVISAMVVYLILIVFPFVSLYDKTEAVTKDLVVDYKITDTVEENEKISVLRVSSGKVEQADSIEYLVGAVACEMPITYHEEALKAQAVACYTYAKRLKSSNEIISHNADITDDILKHQGYLNKDELKAKWGEKFEMYYSKLNRIVTEVKGEYLSYENKPILTAYHAISSGITNSAKDIWNNEIAYLQSVSSPGDNLSSDIDSTNTLKSEEIIKLASEQGIDLSNTDTKNLISVIETAENGCVLKAKVGNTEVNGEEFRTMFSLNSPSFTMKYNNGEYIIRAKGKGHGVGMSQNSADFMARQGSTYKEILTHFYPGTTLERI